MGMRAPEPGELNGPMWKDVWLLMEELNRELKGRCVLEMCRASYGTAIGRLDLSLRRSRGRTDWFTVATVGASWPTGNARTMPALLIRLLWQLEDAVAEAETRAALAVKAPEGELPLPPGQ